MIFAASTVSMKNPTPNRTANPIIPILMENFRPNREPIQPLIGEKPIIAMEK